jgi:hypothetical protein
LVAPTGGGVINKRLFLAVALCASAAALPAQTPALELRPFGGASIPTGTQRDYFKDAAMFGIQGAIELKPALHMIGSFSWVDGKNKYSVSNLNVDIFQYDVGAELGLVTPLGASWEMKPFLGFGAGARTYRFSADQLSNKTCALGYGSVGSEFQLTKFALRLEARENVFCYKSPIIGQKSKTRNDLGLSFGIAYHVF